MTFPAYISAVFLLTAFIAILLFYRAANQSKVVLWVLIVWSVIQSVIASTGFYLKTDTLPPRFALVVVPALLTIILMFTTRAGRIFVDTVQLKWLTLLHVVRLPVELVLLLLYREGAVPELMTFEGRNYDILSGISAPAVYYLAFVKKSIGKKNLLVWNVVCLLLLLNIVVNGILSVPTPFQKFGFEQPNVALLYFPFLLLPGLIVPLVLFSHLSAFRHLIRK